MFFAIATHFSQQLRRAEANHWSKGPGTSSPTERFPLVTSGDAHVQKSGHSEGHGSWGLDGKHVGTVDHLETADRIILSKNDPKAGGRHHLISIDWVDYVDQKVHLNKPSTKAISEWQAAA
jgi:hypothetical protein